MNFQMYRKPPHCLCSFLKCFQKKTTFILHRGSENMFNTDKRLPLVVVVVASIVSQREKVTCPRLVPEPGQYQASDCCGSIPVF